LLTSITFCSYFNTEDVLKPVKQQEIEEEDTNITDLPIITEKTNDNTLNRVLSKELDALDVGTPCLPAWKYDETDTNDVSESEKENSPTPENTSAPMSCSSAAAAEHMEDTSLLIDDPQTSSTSDSSVDTTTGVTNKMKRLLNLKSSQNSLKMPTSRKRSTPMTALHKFTYQPKLGTSMESSTYDDGGNEALESLPLTQEVIDSGYLSDEEESTDADTPSDDKRDVYYSKTVKKDTRTPLRCCSVGDIRVC
jgi:hypothetical protein